MKITELIKKLEKIKCTKWNLEVEIRPFEYWGINYRAPDIEIEDNTIILD